MPEEKQSDTLTFNDLLKAGLHFGHQTKRWNPKMKRYIFGKRNGIHIIDLAQTLDKFAEAKAFLEDTIMRGRKVLLVGTKKQAKDIIQKKAEEDEQPYVVNRWLGGMLTNAKTVRKSVERMRELEKMQEEGPEKQRSKRELAKLGRELAKLHTNLNGIRDMERLPGAMVIIDINRESNAIKEARCLNIPVVATVDTNCDPDLVDYPIPANDDSIRSVELIINEIGGTIKAASEKHERVAAERKRERDKAEAEEKAAAEAATKARKQKDEAQREARKRAVEKAKKKALKQAAGGEAQKDADAESAEKAPAQETSEESDSASSVKSAEKEKASESATEDKNKEEAPSDNATVTVEETEADQEENGDEVETKEETKAKKEE